jgi:hypothetical protein
METLPELRELVEGGREPCVSLYLNVLCKDEPDRERARLFLERRVRRAREAARDPRIAASLGKVEEAATARLAPDGGGRAVAIFACESLFKVIDLDVAVEDELVVGSAPALRQLAMLAGAHPRAVVILVSAEDARIYEVVLGQATVAATIQGEHINQHRSSKRSPGWIDLHYQRHVREHIDRHLREVADRATKLVDARPTDQVVVGGAHPTVDRFLHELPTRLRTRVIDVIALPPDAPLAEIVSSAMASLEEEERRVESDGVKRTIDLALADGPAALGIPEVLEAARERRLMTLYVAYGFRAQGARCRECRALSDQERGPCAFCSSQLEPVELSEALVRETIAQDGSVELVPRNADLERVGGVAAMLRW